jgi:hypothetical protein
MKITFGVISGFLLIALFFVVYSVVSNLTPGSVDLKSFDTKPVTIGKVGGFHWLTDIKVLARDKYDTVAIYTNLNRSTIVEDIATPLAELTPDGKVGLRLKLTDTSVMSDLPKADYERLSHQTVTNSIIEDVALSNPKSLDTQEVIIRLSKASRYRLTEDPQNPGIIYLDVLK